MSKKHRDQPQPQVPPGTARMQRDEQPCPVGVDGAGHGPIRPAEAELLGHVVPCRQKAVQALLDGKAPGLQQRLAPNARVSDVEGWVEDDETVDRLARWHREAPHG